MVGLDQYPSLRLKSLLLRGGVPNVPALPSGTAGALDSLRVCAAAGLASTISTPWRLHDDEQHGQRGEVVERWRARYRHAIAAWVQ